MLIGLAVLATAALCWNRPEAAPPQPIAAPAQGSAIDQPAVAPAAADATLVAANGNAADAEEADSVLRIEVAAAAADRTAQLQVLVVQTGGSEPQPLAGVDVLVQLSPANPATGPAADAEWVGRTDRRGQVRFELAGAAGRTASVRSALGGEAIAELVAAAPTPIVLSIAPRAIVAGMVVDERNAGVANADLLLLPWAERADGAGAAPRRVGRSGADGSFRIGLAQGGRLGAQHRSYGPSPMYLVVAARGGSEPRPQDLVLPLRSNTVILSGTVVGADRQPVADAELEFRSTSKVPRGAELAAPPQRVRSDSRGAFVVSPLIPGPVHYTVRRRGHGTARGQLPLAVAQPPVILVLPPPCQLIGRATDGDGQPLALVQIRACDRDGTLAAADSGADGTFQLDDLPTGPLLLRAKWRADRDSAWLVASAELTLVPASPTSWQPVLTPEPVGRQFRGRLSDATGAPLAGYRLRARSSLRGGAGLGAPLATSGADGAFTIAAPGQGAIDLHAFAPDRELNGFADTVWRGLEPGPSVQNLTLQAPGFAGLRGRVESDQQLPLPASLQLWHHQRGEYVVFAATADGSFVRGDVPAGTIDLQVEASGMAAMRRSGVAIEAGVPLDLGVLVLSAGAVLQGTVRGPGGAVPPTCELSLWGEGVRLHARYENGDYRFDGVPPGPLQLQVQAAGHAAARFPIELAAQEQRTQPIELRAGVPRSVCVHVPASGGDVVWLTVRSPATGLQLTAVAPVQRARADAIGEADFEVWLQPGSYEVAANGSGKWQAQTVVAFAAGLRDAVPLTLQQQ